MQAQSFWLYKRGQVQVTIKSADLDGLQNALRGLGMTIFGGTIAAASIMVGFDVLARAGFGVVEAPLIAAGLFVLAGGCFGVSFAWYMTGGHLPRINLASLFRWRSKARARRGEP